MQEETDLDARDIQGCARGQDWRRRLFFHAFRDAIDLGVSVVAAGRSVNHAAKEHRQEHEVVVLNPDHGARLELRLDSLGELEVGLAVGEPILLVEVHLTRVVMEKRPKDGVGETVVVTVGDIIIQVDGLAAVLFHEPLVDIGAILDWDEEPGPADPGEVEGLLEAAQCRDEAAGGHLEVVLALGILVDGDGEAVRDDDEVTAEHFGFGLG